MTRARQDGLCLLFLGATMVLLMACLMWNSSDQSGDFRPIYYSARCLLQHSDPYSESEISAIIQKEDGNNSHLSADERQITTRPVYPPTEFSISVLFAMLPWKTARIVWMMLIVASLLLASYLAWDIGADDGPVLTGVLIGFLLANTELLIMASNPAGVAVSFCVVAVWCFFRNRFVPAGILCLAISLVIKPQDSGLVWLYFLLAGGVYRKRALQTILVTAGLSLPAILWVWHISPHWIQEWHSNVMSFSLHGGINNPGPLSAERRGPGYMVINLQTLFSFFWDDPRFYNPASYFVCAPFLLAWGLITLRARPSPARSLLALAAIAALSMLPVYHRQTDAKLLLLTVPACAMLWVEGGLNRWLALIVNSTAIVLNGDLPWMFFRAVLRAFHQPATKLSEQIVIALQMLPTSFTLLVMGVFYLWIYAQRCKEPSHNLQLQSETGIGTS